MGFNPVRVACEHGHLQVVVFLIGRVELNDSDILTLLEVVCRNGHVNLLAYFLEQSRREAIHVNVEFSVLCQEILLMCSSDMVC